MKASAFLFALLAASAHAGPRTSANYSITTDTTDVGGTRATSASYTDDGSIGEMAGISTVASPAQTEKAGYVGQLYEVTGLTLTGGSSTVSEGAALQLGAWQALDDASFLAVPAASVAWSVQSGPLVSISAGGLATAGAVYQNSAASVEGSFGGFIGGYNLTMIESIADNFGTYAGDGLGDDWQVQYFGLGNPWAAPGLDPDSDGQTNLFEFNAGLVPTDPASRFESSIVHVPGQPSQTQIIFSPLVAGRTYIVQFRPSLATGSWQTLTGTTQNDNGTERTVTDLNAPRPRFYNVRILKP